jgi:hypothetical protein
MHIVTMVIALHAADKKSKESFTARQRLFAGIYCLLMVERSTLKIQTCQEGGFLYLRKHIVAGGGSCNAVHS